MTDPLPTFGVDEARRLVTTRFGGGAAEITELAGGAWSKAFAFRLGPTELILRVSALEEDFRKDERVAPLAAPLLPVPRVVEVGQTGQGWYAISERAHGAYLESLDTTGMSRVLPSLLRTLDAIREVDIEGTSGFGVWGATGDAPHPSWAAYLVDVAVDRPERREHGWRPRLRASVVGDQPFEDAFSVLRGLAPHLPEARHLVHSDLLNRNVLVDDDRVTAVLDWGSSLYGDFVYDVAWLEFFRPWYRTWETVDIEGAARKHWVDAGLVVEDLDRRLLACQLHIGLSGQAYTAFRGFWPALRWLADRTLEVAAGAR